MAERKVYQMATAVPNPLGPLPPPPHLPTSPLPQISVVVVKHIHETYTGHV